VKILIDGLSQPVVIRRPSRKRRGPPPAFSHTFTVDPVGSFPPFWFDYVLKSGWTRRYIFDMNLPRSFVEPIVERLNHGEGVGTRGGWLFNESVNQFLLAIAEGPP
jgi:hypothetical protein